ncbi:MAG: bifunctional [glutamate--ammonia ligase]-adenylyl-L-tyrosine phosphorylase/[glutamate--ammonia-ligase] adenylyltransferase, partial [Quisquiliibacterium sp.]
IREIEFIAQVFQIVRGGRDPGLRDRRTLVTLAALGDRGILLRNDAHALTEAYELLRRIEHALQYQEDAQTHRLPEDSQARDRVAAMLGMGRDQFERALEFSRSAVQRVFDDLLKAPENRQPSMPGVAGEGDKQLSEALATRLQALRDAPRYRGGAQDTRDAIESVLARAFDDNDDQAALTRLIELIETVLGRPAYIALLAQFPQAQHRVMTLLGKAKWAADYLNRHPILLDELLDGQLFEPTDYAAWESALRGALDEAQQDGEPDLERQMDLMREAHHAQVFRLLAQDLEGLHSVEQISDHLSELADRVIAITLDLIWPQVRTRHRQKPRFAVIAYGRLGGKELGYASDLDLVYLYDDADDSAQVAYSQLGIRLGTWLSSRTAAGLLFEVDLRLRPNGDAGLIVCSLSGFQSYQRESAWVWEHQALTRARFVAGDPRIGEDFERERRQILSRRRDLDSLRKEVVSMRQRMHEGHPNRSELFDLKHDEGGMVDIEFIVQTLVLAHSHDHPELLENLGNIALLQRAGRAGLIDAELAERVCTAYRSFRRLQHALRLNHERYARVHPQTVHPLRDDVKALWRKVIGTTQAG